LSRLVNFFVRSPFAALCALSLVAAILGALLLVRAASALLGNEWLGVAAALLFYLSPAMLVFGPLPNAEATSIAFVIGAFHALVREKPVVFAATCAAAIGCRPQLAPAIGLVFVVGLLKMPRRREAILLFALVIGVSFVPLIEAGGWNFPISREGSLRELVMRFVAHPWGSKFLSLPLLAMAAIGIYRVRALFAVALFGGTHLAFTILTGTLTDGVQPVLPALLAIAVLAAAAFTRVPIVAAVAAIAYAAGSIAYTAPILLARRATSSPPAQAAAAMGGNPVVLADPELAPHAAVAGLEAWNFSRFDELAERPEVPAALLVEGASQAPGAKTFSWPDSDAYGKLTTERFRVVSLVPLPPENRYRGRAGVYPMENAPEQGEWRWLASEAIIDLPAARPVTLHLALPARAPIESNEVSVNGVRAVVRRGESAEVSVGTAEQITIRSARAFTAPDGRELAVQLTSLNGR
jgi:hypothetical protein